MSANDPNAAPPSEENGPDQQATDASEAAAPPQAPSESQVDSAADGPPAAPPAAPPPGPPAAAGEEDAEARQWAMFIHLSLFAGYVVPMAGLVLPIILWQVKKDELPSIDAHGKMVVNWIISLVIYSMVCFILLFVFIGLLGFFVLGILSIVFPIIGAIKANEGTLWEYPLTIKLLK